MASKTTSKESSTFFKVILHQNLEDKKLKVPPKFVMLYGKELSTEVTLTVPNGGVWRVKLVKTGNKIWFQDGFFEFIKCNVVSTGFFMVFKYKSCSSFKVRIYDLTACEISYPVTEIYKKEEPLQQDEPKTDVDVEILDVKPPSSTLMSMKNKPSAESPASFEPAPCRPNLPRMSPPHVDLTKMAPAYVNPIRMAPSQVNQTKTCLGSAPGKSKSKQDDKQKNKRPMAEETKMVEETKEAKKPKKVEEVKVPKAEASILNRKKTVIQVQAHQRKVGKESDKYIESLEKRRIFVNNRFKSITETERDNANNAINLFKPTQPSFMLIMQSTDIVNRRFYVPAKFSQKYLSKKQTVAKIVEANGRRCWKTSVAWVPQCFLSKMGEFTRELDVGDICMFEMVRRDKLKFKVSVLKNVKYDLSDM